jgi:hypothetical protein
MLYSAKAGVKGMDSSLHFTVPFMNRLNQTEPATFSILSFWAFFRDSYFLYFGKRTKKKKKLGRMEASTGFVLFIIIMMLKQVHLYIYSYSFEN